MSTNEVPSNLKPGELLREQLLKGYQLSHPDATPLYSALERAHAVANNMEYMFSFWMGSKTTHTASDIAVRTGGFCLNELESLAAQFGLGTVDSLKLALTQLRAALKEDLPEADWNRYFGRTLDQ